MLVAAKDPAETRHDISDTAPLLAGNMPTTRLLDLVNKLSPDHDLDVMSLDIPEVKKPFDELCNSRHEMR